MANYITQILRFDGESEKVKGQFLYGRSSTKVRGHEFTEIAYNMMSETHDVNKGFILERYGGFTTIPRAGCENLRLTGCGVLYNIKKGYTIKPLVEFDKDGKPVRANLPGLRHDKLVDVGEAILYTRYRVDPSNFKVEYDLLTDGISIFISELRFTFREPISIDFPRKERNKYDFKALNFFGDTLISRKYKNIYVSKRGAVYNAWSKQWMSTYTKIYDECRFSRRHEDRTEEDDENVTIQAIVYLYGKMKHLLSVMVEEWSGLDLPDGYQVINTSGIDGRTNLNEYRVVDSRIVSDNKRNPNSKVIEKRTAAANTFREKVQEKIDETTTTIYNLKRRIVNNSMTKTDRAKLEGKGDVK